MELRHKDEILANLQAQILGEAYLREEVTAVKQENERMRRMFQAHQKEKTEILKLFDSMAKENVELKKRGAPGPPSFGSQGGREIGAMSQPNYAAHLLYGSGSLSQQNETIQVT